MQPTTHLIERRLHRLKLLMLCQHLQRRALVRRLRLGHRLGLLRRLVVQGLQAHAQQAEVLRQQGCLVPLA